MRHLFAMVQTLVFGHSIRRWAFFGVWLTALMSSFFVMGCGSVTTEPESTENADLKLVKEKLRPLCFEPPEVTAAKVHGDDDIFFAFVPTTGEAVTSRDRWVLDQALYHDGFVFKYDVDAPVKNLKLVPLSRADAWCTRIPKPTDEAVLKLLDPCAGATSTAELAPATKNLLGQTVSTERTSYLCGQRPQMALTTQEQIGRRQRNDAYQSAVDLAERTAVILTQAEAEAEAVLNQSDGWLKQALTKDPGSIEQIQQRLADQLNNIEAFPEYDDRYLEMLAISGYNAGFANGKFKVQAKLFAIDAGIMLIEFAVLEITLGPLGGAKFLASAVQKGAKAVSFATTKGGKALAAAMQRLEDIPIFIPVGAGGLGTTVRVGEVIGSISAKAHRYRLEKALAAAKGALQRIRGTGESLHHMVAHTEPRAVEARKILDTFNINVDDAWNGVFLPATLKSPNPKGAIVHSVVHTDKYYIQVEEWLKTAKTQGDAIRVLRRIRETLENGTFFHAKL